MLEISGDLFAQDGWIAIPTNGIVKADSRLVMGAGLAKEANLRWTDIDLIFGKHVQEHGNVPCAVDSLRVISFPTKEHFKYNSSIYTIERSACCIRRMVDYKKIEKLYLPKVGCGFGKLSWNNVKAALEEWFKDDRFVVVL
jgi:hypothetical protein